MTPAIEVTGKKDPSVQSRLLPGETEEYGRAIWHNVVATLVNHTLLNQLHPFKYTPEVIASSLIDSLSMPPEIAAALVTATLACQVGFAVESTTIFEQKGHIGGPRHYENFRIR